jgi:hypothetical protein
VRPFHQFEKAYALAGSTTHWCTGARSPALNLSVVLDEASATDDPG